MENNHGGAEPTGVDSARQFGPESEDLQATPGEVGEVETGARTKAEDITDVADALSDAKSAPRPRLTGWKEFSEIDEDGKRKGPHPWHLTNQG